MRRRPTGATHKKADLERKDILSANTLSPGDLVYVDQYESSIRGRLQHTYGKEKQSSMYCGGTIFVDVASGTVHVYHQVSLAAADTLLSKAQFEHEACTHGIEIKKYHTDNSIFVSEAWKEHLHGMQQTQRISATGAHHQNAIAERAIQTVTTSARAMLLHLKVHWPDEYDTKLWPFALQYAAWLYNYTPKSNNLAPIEIFTHQMTNCEFLRRAKVFGCPVYVLEPRLQDGKKIPKWEPRARRAQLIGFSKEHSSLSALVRNLRTSAITPQFHFVADQRFETVMGGVNPSLKFDLTDPENIGTFLKTRWDTDDRDHALEHWDPEIDGEMPPLGPEWDTHPIDGQDLPVNPDLRGPHSLPP
jgi:hypothetical protein